MTIARWQPFREFLSLRQVMDRLIEDPFDRPYRPLPGNGEELHPAMDVYETPDDVVVKMSLPGVNPEEVHVNITGDSLTISGQRKEDTTRNGADYRFRELRHGSYGRSIRIPSPVRSEKAEATYENGILTLTIPKLEEAKTRTVKVKVAKGE